MQSHQEDVELHSRSDSQEQALQEDEVLQLQSDLRDLRDTLPVVYGLIDLAEWRNHEQCVAKLLEKLKDAVYEAEDLIDEFAWYELKVSAEGNATSVQPYIDFFRSVTRGRFNKVTDIHKRLTNRSSDLKDMGLLRQVSPRFDKAVRPETSSFPTETKIFGREEEVKQVIKCLGVPAKCGRTNSKRKRRSAIVESASNQVNNIHGNNETIITNFSVLPIVGLGGVGKTTLAQNICNHPQVKSHFDLIIWICVSDDFDVKRLTKEAIQSYSKRDAVKDNLNSLQNSLAIKLKTKRLLLVLDDMWDDALKKNGQCWERFCVPLKNVLHGSMIMVTTRSQNVADRVHTMDPIKLEGLKDDVFWDFFKHSVFGLNSSQIEPELERIGRNILPKLMGSPLAAKTVGRLLQISIDTTHWENILNSELWDLEQEETDILPALRLSYIYLPLHLKRCFSFCAVYPKDYKFQKRSLAEIWIAEGFVEPRGDIPIENIDHRYFYDLVNRSFFEKHRGTYVIHDLIHDMAQLVSKDECFTIKFRVIFRKSPQAFVIYQYSLARRLTGTTC
ncbi:disease resistance protein RGA2-like [Setaria viridis]|uniref:disease resistance protein RGA2-like n=1 Tax=Setaria viridis TaxID=4556 RepID=UPI003B3B8F04